VRDCYAYDKACLKWGGVALYLVRAAAMRSGDRGGEVGLDL
jgi:hypothetical protein